MSIHVQDCFINLCKPGDIYKRKDKNLLGYVYNAFIVLFLWVAFIQAVHLCINE